MVKIWADILTESNYPAGKTPGIPVRKVLKTGIFVKEKIEIIFEFRF